MKTTRFSLEGVARGGLALAMLTALVVAGPLPARAQSGGGCRLTGSATFSPGLTYAGNAAGATSTFRFSGNLTLCASAPDSGPSTGTASIGNVFTDPATGYKWQEPIGQAQGGCASSATRAHTLARWADGTLTLIEQETTSVSGQVVLTARVVDRIVVAASDPQPEQPAGLELVTTRYAGGTVAGQLNVTGPTTAIVSCATSGLGTLTLDGAVALATP